MTLPQAERDMNTEKSLAEGISRILSVQAFQNMHNTSKGLSGLFVPSVPAGYLASSKRLLLVGKETRGWLAKQTHGLLHDTTDTPTNGAWLTYLAESQNAHWDYWSRPESAGRSPFLSFLKRCKSSLQEWHGVPSVIWANLFCASYYSRSPRHSLAFEHVCELSKAMLLSHISILKPTNILFVTGPGYDKYIKAFFEIKDSEVIEPRRLWHFKANGIPAVRTPHPQYAASNSARLNALETLRDGPDSEGSSHATACTRHKLS